MTKAAAATALTAAANDPATVGITAKDRRERAGIARALTGCTELAATTAGSVDELLAQTSAWNLLVFHCDAVGSGELSVFGQLKRDLPDTLIIVVCESTNGRGARRALDVGIDGLVFAEGLDATLAPTVTAVLAGQTVVPRALRTSVRKPSLSFREKQILGLVVMGFTNGEIGARLFLAESTVKSHLSSAFSKLGVKSRSEAAAMILDPQGSLGTGILSITGGGPVT